MPIVGRPNQTNQKNITAIASARKVVFPHLVGALWITNTHATDALQVSLDGGVTYFSMPAGANERHEAVTNVIYIRRGGSNDILVEFVVEHFGIRNGFKDGITKPANSQSHSQT